MKKYSAVPHRLYLGKDGKIIHFDEDYLNLTELSELHRVVLAEFSKKRTREEVIAIHDYDLDVVAMVDDLIKLKLLRSALPSRPHLQSHLKPNIKAFRIVLTENCNLRCVECFVTKNVNTPQTMSQKTLDRVIRATILYGKRGHIIYQFFGGEPLLRFDYIKRAVEILEEAIVCGEIVRPLYTITTNATVLTKEIITFFKKYDFKVGVSVDGPEEINDQFRIYANGRGTFKSIERNYMRLLQAGIDCHALITPHPNHLDELPRIFRSVLEAFPMKMITVNTPLRFDTVQWTVSGEQYASLLIELLHIAREFRVSVDSAASPPLAALAGNIRREGPCALTGDNVMVSIGPDGSMSFCPQKWHSFLAVSITADTKLQIPIRRATDCLTCEARRICGGPCPSFQRISGGSLDKNKCDFMRALLRDVTANLDLFETPEQ